MGQARLRGTYEERKRKGEQKKEQDRLERERQAAYEESILTPEERAKRLEFRMKMATMVGLAFS